LYRQAILDNRALFTDKIVMDVGAGSGILSIFAVQAGAKNYQDKIEVICGKIEEITEDIIPLNCCDILVSEPIGHYLFNERMIETYVIARDKFMKKGGMMFPKSAHLCLVPFEDKDIYTEQINKCDFWKTTDF
jgi:histone-arginine methyltransferase CARM1